MKKYSKISSDDDVFAQRIAMLKNAINLVASKPDIYLANGLIYLYYHKHPEKIQGREAQFLYAYTEKLFLPTYKGIFRRSIAAIIHNCLHIPFVKGFRRRR